MSNKLQKQLKAAKRYEADQMKKAKVSKPAQTYASRVQVVHQDTNYIKQQQAQMAALLAPPSKNEVFKGGQGFSVAPEKQQQFLQPQPVKTQEQSLTEKVTSGISKVGSFLGGIGKEFLEKSPLYKAVKEKSFKPLTEAAGIKERSQQEKEDAKRKIEELKKENISKEEAKKRLANLGYSRDTIDTALSAIPMGETGAIGKEVGRVVKKAIQKEVSSKGVGEIIEKGAKGLFKPTSEIKSAAIKVGDKVYEGVSHADAISKAPKELQKELMASKEEKGLFKTKDGKLITREEANKQYGITHSEEVPHLKEKQIETKTPKVDIKSLDDAERDSIIDNVKKLQDKGKIPVDDYEYISDALKRAEKGVIKKEEVHELNNYLKEKGIDIYKPKPKESPLVISKPKVAEVKTFDAEKVNRQIQHVIQGKTKKPKGMLLDSRLEFEKRKALYEEGIRNAKEKPRTVITDKNIFDKKIDASVKFEREASKKKAKESVLKWQRETVAAKEKANVEASKLKIKNDNLDTITKHQAGQSYEGKQQIEKVFKDLGEKAKKEGFEFEYKQNYLPQVYENSTDDVMKAMAAYMKDKGVDPQIIDDYIHGIIELDAKKSGELGLSPSFTKSSAFPSYDVAMKYGLKPKYNSISALVGHYNEKLGTAVANRKLIEDLAKKGEIKAIKGPGMVAVNLPGSEVGYFAKPETAKFINDLFRNEEALNGVEKFFKYGSKASGELQNLVLAGGVPKSSLNFFTFGHVIKSLTTGLGNVVLGDVRGAMTNLKSVTNLIRSNFTGASIKFFAEKQDIITKMAQEGIDLTSRIGNFKETNRGFKNFFTKTDGKKLFGEGYGRLFDEKTFNSFLPQQQISVFEGAYKSALSKGISEEEASKIAGETVKKFTGSVNTLRGKTAQDAIGTVFFAPKFRESLIDTYWNTIKSISPTTWKDASYKQNRALLAGMGMSLVGYDLLNKKLSGHHMWENPAGHEMELMIPREDGRVFYTGFMPSQLAFFRNMVEGTSALVQGQIRTAVQKYGSNLSMGVKAVTDITSNQDYFGNQIYDPAAPVKEQLSAIGKYLGLGYNHPYVKGVYNLILNQQAEKQPIWDKYKKITDLQQSGKNFEAKMMIDDLSNEEKDAYYAMKKEQLKPVDQVISEMMELPIKFSTLGKIKTQEKYASYDEIERKLKAIKDPEEQKKAFQEYLSSIPTQSERQSAAYYLSQKGISTKGTTVSENIIKGKPVYDRIMELYNSGNKSEATKEFEKLSEEEKKQFKAVMKSEKSKKTSETKDKYKSNIKEIAETYKTSKVKAIEMLEKIPQEDQAAVIAGVKSLMKNQ